MVFARVSPGFTPRPSLSASRTCRHRSSLGRVSPGFTPRPSLSDGRAVVRVGVRGVSPGFTPRPSLSGRGRGGRADPGELVSPGFTPRPSLSVPRLECERRSGARVAGVHAPAFVERSSRRPWARSPRSVAGVHAPAFVERGSPFAIAAPNSSTCRRAAHPTGGGRTRPSQDHARATETVAW